MASAEANSTVAVILSDIVDTVVGAKPLKTFDEDREIIVKSLLQELLSNIPLRFQNDNQCTAQDVDQLQVVPSGDTHQEFTNLADEDFYHSASPKAVKVVCQTEDGCSETCEEAGDCDTTLDLQTVPISKEFACGDYDNGCPLVIRKDDLFSSSNQSNADDISYAAPKRKHEEEEVFLHPLCGVAMPKFLNAVPRLGLSKNSKIPKLHH